MNRTRSAILPVFLSAVLLGFPLYGQGVKKIAQAGMKWNMIPVGARASAMGGAFTALSNDASAVFWNPAGLNQAGSGVFLSQNMWIADIVVNAGALSYDLGSAGVLAVSYAKVDWGVLHGTVRDPSVSAGFRSTGEFSPKNFGGGISYARTISDRFGVGMSVRYLYEDLGANWVESLETGPDGEPYDYKFEAQMGVVAFDFGTIFNTGFKDLRLGMSLKNFSQEMIYREEWFPLQLTFNFGIAMDILNAVADIPGQSLTLAVDAVDPRDFTARVHVGGEYSFRNLLFLRTGYKTNYDEESISFGGGLNYSMGSLGLGLDYAFLQFTNFDPVQIFSFNFKF